MAESNVIRTAQALGITAPFFMSGIYFCSSYLAIPHLYDLPVSTSTPIFSKIYHDGAALFVPLAAIPTIANAYLAYSANKESSDREKASLYAAAAVTVISSIVFTIGFMLKGINKLNSIAGSRVEQEKVSRDVVRSLLQTWVGQNYVRAVLSFIGGTIAVYATFA